MQTHHQNSTQPASIVSTHFDLSQFEGQLGGAAQDLPIDMPSLFDDDPAFVVDAAPPHPVAPAATPVAAPAASPIKSHSAVKFKAIRIARALSGTSELRLTEEITPDGEKPYFYFEEVQQYPYQTKRMLIVSATKAVDIDALKGDDDVKVTSKQAEKYFTAAVAKKYPDETTRGGVTMSSYINVL